MASIDQQQISAGMRVGVEVRRSSIDGLGLFATEPIRGRTKLGDFVGERISERTARKRAKGARRIAIVELGNGTAIDASVGGNGFRYINHSCAPNSYMRIIRNNVEFYALRDIAPGEELTCNYGETHHEGTLGCRCGSAECRGMI
ncbi:MAG: SET domain-containing protein-lysine N-methyltransferase [Bacteroidetes bacterium]|nr:SET domain-containing protein-lysine N-methyltransferase [Bacteroidota bacterium]